MLWTKETTRWIISNTWYEVLTTVIALLLFVLIFSISLLGHFYQDNVSNLNWWPCVCKEHIFQLAVVSLQITCRAGCISFSLCIVGNRAPLPTLSVNYQCLGILKALMLKFYSIYKKRRIIIQLKSVSGITHASLIAARFQISKRNIARGHVKQLLSLDSPRSKNCLP